ncbi:f-box domain-containing protein [Fusarium denticulatum]|uniref:F-box domain-containing protein n=1 Tax=Fusarium denticulatum TaxID=48507 RepID=A0A8H5WTK1_9HYPO|nr:f-box domain-containing protein [Fusarium denticulatum]
MNSLDSLTQTPSDRLSLLSGIPIDIILHHLDPASFINLRLTSRQLATKTIHSRFFRSAKTDLSLASIQSLKDRAYHLQLGPLLRELTVVATLYDTQPAEATVQTRKKWSGFDKEELRHDTEKYHRRVGDLRERNVDCTDEEVQEVQQDLEWMQTRIHQDRNTDVGQVTDLLSSILGNAPNLRAINLDACIIAGRTKTCRPAEHYKWYRSAHQTSSWPSIWTAASQTFRIVTSAISHSEIQLEKLQIFPGTPLCSVQLRHVEDHLRTLGDGFADACKNIKSFGLSFSTHILIETAPDQVECLFRHAFSANSRFRLGQHLEYDSENFTGAATILGYMPNLTSLDLHLHHLDHLLLPQYTRAFAQVSQNIRLGSLRELSLRGLPLRPDNLILFLTKHPTITELSLDGILLIDGSWSSVFSCVETMPALESLHLRSLSTEYHHITNLDPVARNFEADLQDRERWAPCGDGYILHTRDICRGEIQQGLNLRPQPGPRNIWRDDTLAYFDRIQYEFGPPSHIWNWDPLNEDM